LLVKGFKEKRAIKSLSPYEDNLPPNGAYKYLIFPKFDLSLFYVPRKIENYNEDMGGSLLLSKTLINNE
jgi:hypothetical protein